MTSYQTAIRSIAAQAMNGDDVEGRITSLSKQLGLDRATVTHEVNEMIDTIKD